MSVKSDGEHLTEGRNTVTEVTAWCISGTPTEYYYLRVQDGVHMLPDSERDGGYSMSDQHEPLRCAGFMSAMPYTDSPAVLLAQDTALGRPCNAT